VTTDLEKVEAAIGADVVVAATAWLPNLATFEPARMSDAEAGSLIDGLKILKVAQQRLDDEQRDLLAPFNAGLQRIRARFASVVDPLKAGILRGKRILQEREAKLEADRRAAQAEADRVARAAAARNATQGGPVRPPVAIQVPVRENVQAGAFGRATGRQTLKVELEDAAKLAALCPWLLRLDEGMARLELRARREQDPEAQLPGVRAWYEKGVAIG
jgi:hypothetical protein